MPGHPYAYTDREILRRFERAPGHRIGYKQLIRELGMGGGRERRLLLEQLTRMTARGALVKLNRDHWSLPPAEKERAARTSGRRSFADEMKARRSFTRENLVAGKLDLHRDGFGFVRPNDEGDDLFIPPNELNGAMQGDEVLVEEAPRSRDGRRSGRIARVLTRRNPTVVGIFRLDRGRHQDNPLLQGNYVVPMDERMTQPILIPEGAEIVVPREATDRTLGEEARAQLERVHGDHAMSAEDLHGLVVDVEITEFPGVARPAKGRIIEVLGEPDAFGVDVEIVIRKHHLPHIFPQNVLEEARERSQYTVVSLSKEEIAGREDFRGLPIVTIDGETAKDFDDAVMVRDLGNGESELQVHIADVAEYVLPDSALDLEARLRGNSVYFPDRAVPMLPQELSNDQCSLRPDEDRLVLSCIMRIDAKGNVLGYRVAEGIIRSARRMTYTNVQKILDGDPQTCLEYQPFVGDFERMLELAQRLNAKRVRRGSIDFDLPEAVIQFDELGAMTGIIRAERAWSNRLIEEFMLCANECVARWIEQQNVPGIFRIHEMPDPKRIVEFEDTAAGFGYSLGVGALPVKKVQMRGDRREQQRRNDRSRTKGRAQTHEIVEKIDVSPKMYQRLVAKITGKPEERILSYLMLRSLKQARYSDVNEGHFALATQSYTHFTSPIRRYPDLIVHRIVKDLLHQGANPEGVGEASDAPPAAASSRPKAGFDEPLPKSEIAAIAQETSETERRAADAERELIEWKKIKFMQDRVGEDFDAMILSATKYGVFVELTDLYVEGLVPIFTMTDDRYTFRENAREICGENTGRCYRPGMKVRVVLDRIDRIQRKLQFAILEVEGEEIARDARPFRKTGKTAARKEKAARKASSSRATEHKRTSPDRSGKPKKARGKGRRR
ncbi:MAG: VacB/RNase II family 3'-5' exoribonuclease [Acidobacteria bacterium]|nr:VacB/RNase II family 3'-5' exoribonuclease [Acidobacteriota bacterium]